MSAIETFNFYSPFESLHFFVYLRSYPGGRRSIFHSADQDQSAEIIPLSFPKHKVCVFARGDCAERTSILLEVNRNLYCPLMMLNSNCYGHICLGIEDLSPIDCFDYLWNSTFTEANLQSAIPVNKSLSIKSLAQWRELTEKDPDFFRKQLDLNYFREESGWRVEISRGMYEETWRDVAPLRGA